MVGLTMVQLVPFTLFFMMWIALFSVCFQVLDVEIDQADEDYPEVDKFFQYLIMTYRNSIGDITAPGYQNWIDSYG